MIKRVKARVLAVLRLANRPLMVQEMMSAIKINENDATLHKSIAHALYELQKEGKVRQTRDVFLKSGTWAKEWEAVR